MHDAEDSRLTYELSRYFTNTEWDRIERTKKIYERIKSEEEMNRLSESTKIPFDHLRLIIAEDYILKLLEGVASGKCGFTTIRNFQYKKPDFPSPKLRNSALFSLLHKQHSITEYVIYFGITGTQSSCLGLCFGP